MAIESNCPSPSNRSLTRQISDDMQRDTTTDEVRRLLEGYIEHYSNVRLNSATGYITPKDC